jgi:hypothetical protein
MQDEIDFCAIKLTGVPMEFDEQILREFFDSFGYVTDCFIPKDQKGPTKMAVISFDSEDGPKEAFKAQSAIKSMSGIKMQQA